MAVLFLALISFSEVFDDEGHRTINKICGYFLADAILG